MNDEKLIEDDNLDFNDTNDSPKELIKEFKKYEGKSLDFDEFKYKNKNATKVKPITKKMRRTKTKMSKVSRRKNRQ